MPLHPHFTVSFGRLFCKWGRAVSLWYSGYLSVYLSGIWIERLSVEKRKITLFFFYLIPLFYMQKLVLIVDVFAFIRF